MRDEPAVAVLIPTLNEAGRIESLLASLASQPIAEIVVADGGSTDGTRQAVERMGSARFIIAPRGRGRQMRAAATATTAPIIVMLHADTCLPPGAIGQIRRLMSAPEIVGGCFRLAFDQRSPMLDLYAWASRYDCRFTTFGDQCLFARRAVLDSVGGIPAWPLLEDVELRRRLTGAGRFVKLRCRVTTSARRFRSRGVLRGQLLNGAVLAGYCAGVPVERLARFYGAEDHCE